MRCRAATAIQLACACQELHHTQRDTAAVYNRKDHSIDDNGLEGQGGGLDLNPPKYSWMQ